jgi:hypothetical protein
VKRDVLSKLANTQYLFINLLEAPVLALILSYIIKYYDINASNALGYTLMKNSNLTVYIFMSVIIAIFVGLTVSAEEIIKDRKILKREAFLNLSWGSYLFSKVAVLFTLSAIQALTYVLIGNSIMEIHGMYWQYWLVLFSCWASANLMGLVISDSFKTVVTIYILIPFLVIPQIILSGIMVKYEKLNPKISSPSSIPFYGEIITSRWGYEALATYQFMENKYQKPLYKYDKVMNQADFKRNYLIKELNTKLDQVAQFYTDPDKKDKVDSQLELLRNEIRLEMKRNRKIPFDLLKSLYRDKLDKDVISATREYLELLSKYYLKTSNNAREKKDEFVSGLQATPQARENYLNLMRAYSNENLEEMVTNKNDIVRVIEFKGRIYQKEKPIYLDPEYPFVKAHFYAPRKQVFGNYFSTFWVNICVIWVTTLILYLVLYFRLLKKFLDLGEVLGEKFASKEG